MTSGSVCDSSLYGWLLTSHALPSCVGCIEGSFFGCVALIGRGALRFFNLVGALFTGSRLLLGESALLGSKRLLLGSYSTLAPLKRIKPLLR